MKKTHLLLIGGVILGGCSMMQGGFLDPKVRMTCPGVQGAIEITTSESTAFISDIKAGKTDGEVCQRNLKFCQSAIKALANGKADCKVEPVM